jgi:hypothetical protein
MEHADIEVESPTALAEVSGRIGAKNLIHLVAKG